MSTDPFDKYKDEPSYFLNGESESASLKKIDERIHDISSSGRKRGPLRWLAMAAMIVFVLFAGRYLMTQDDDGANLAAAYFEAYPNYQMIASRGADDSVALSIAYEAYDNGKYGVAAAEFKKQSILSANDGLYYAISLQSQHKWDISLRMLFRIRNELPEEYVTVGEWYLALALIALERSEEAMPILKAISTTDSVFAQKANNLLDEIK